MVMAGVYDSTDGCAMTTAPSQGVMAALHNRMTSSSFRRRADDRPEFMARIIGRSATKVILSSR
jgi:hypothetical protein